MAEADATAIDAILDQIVSLANHSRDGLFLFGGAATGRSPLVEFAGGWRYQGVGEGMLTDLGLLHDLPVTMSGADVFGALSTASRGSGSESGHRAGDAAGGSRRSGRHGVQPGCVRTTTPPDRRSRSIFPRRST